ncbi:MULTISPECIES: NAD(P)/FAD-dependent oxidoreductase [unclassified Leifsonia]|uniref:NAD(P)/FAD-dependent oxidoreductase n=1 Tax=unclassified Leifsonia TaxID=2663824 RepID=UPI0006FC8AA2|nr:MULTISPECIES: NAD(P)/FAD-dependent oxidoreductase [unclassified Leifsonia]KQX05120.1 phytoene dehydrogenase [Leifsonia sp. Root1293]KRA08753.1 phytoene dehydrogenase [Leifsonia sp. Root60]
MDANDVIIIGAGLAGLRCAVRLAESGLDVVVLEAQDGVGGRERTDVIDGFRLDRGFHVLNPAYPAVKRWVDVADLRMRPFPVGVRVRRGSGTVELRHPVRHPLSLPASLRSGLLTPRDTAALVRWITPVLLRPRAVISGTDRTLDDGWNHVGLRGPLRTEVLEPFLAGVLADDRGETSDSFARLLVRMFILGRPGLPEAGIGALPAQLARSATASGADVRLGMRVRRITTRSGMVEVDVEQGDTVRARSVVVAVGPEAAAGLLDVPRLATKGLQTWWFATDTPPASSAMLAVDGRRAGPVVNTVVISNAVPSYAPSGRHLIEATCLLPDAARTHSAAAPREVDVRRQLGEIWSTDAATWSLLRRDDIPHALPTQPPPLRTRLPSPLSAGVFVAGDHRDTASIQGALVSGERAARAVLTEFSQPPEGLVGNA